MEETNQHLLQPLIHQISHNSAINHHLFTKAENDHYKNTSIILIRLVVVFFAGLVSLWANYEASKGFAITIVNEADINAVQGKRFDLFYVSNDEATRLVLKTSKFVEHILYPAGDHESYKYYKKKVSIKHVTLRLSSRNLTCPVIVEYSCLNDGQFVLHISPSIFDSPNYKHDMFVAVQKGMSRIWLWNSQAPASVVNGMTEKMLDDALGIPAWHECEIIGNSSSTSV